MSVRTIPDSFPALKESDFHSRRVLRATLIRRLVHAQNYLWAKAYRVYGGCAYEGHGNVMEFGRNEPALNEYGLEQAPGPQSGKVIASFACPRNWGPSQRVRIQGRSILNQASGHAAGNVVAGVYKLNGEFIGIWANATYSTHGNNDWSMTVPVPGNDTYQIRVWQCAGLDWTGFEGGRDKDEVLFVSARYEVGNATECFGDTPATAWQPIAHTYLNENYHAVTSALLRTLVRNTVHMYAYRAPELCQSYLGQPYSNSASYFEVGRYKVYVPPTVNKLKAMLGVFCTHTGAGNDVRILLGGVNVWGSGTLSTGYQELTTSQLTVVPGTEITVTVEARSTAAASHWGTIVEGVWLWEDNATLSLPAGSSDPSSYTPVDEATLEADDPVLESIFQKLIKNDAWLAKQRLRWLIGDWRHRTYKRAAADNVGLYAGGFDYTRGDDSTGNYPRQPKNITVNGNGLWVDDGGNNGSAHDEADGIGRWQFGMGDNNSIDSWPVPQKQFRHGRRVCRNSIQTPASGFPISSETYARIAWMLRGRRLRPQYLRSYDNGRDGPTEEEDNWRGLGWFGQYQAGIAGLRMDVTGSGGKPDTDACWYGPISNAAAQVAGMSSIRGRLTTNNPGVYTMESVYFEMELQTSVLFDAPLTEGDINLLP